MGNTTSERGHHGHGHGQGHGGGHGERHRRDGPKAKEEHRTSILMDSTDDADMFHDDPKVCVNRGFRMYCTLLGY